MILSTFYDDAYDAKNILLLKFGRTLFRHFLLVMRNLYSQTHVHTTPQTVYSALCVPRVIQHIHNVHPLSFIHAAPVYYNIILDEYIKRISTNIMFIEYANLFVYAVPAQCKIATINAIAWALLDPSTVIKYGSANAKKMFAEFMNKCVPDNEIQLKALLNISSLSPDCSSIKEHLTTNYNMSKLYRFKRLLLNHKLPTFDDWPRIVDSTCLMVGIKVLSHNDYHTLECAYVRGQNHIHDMRALKMLKALFDIKYPTIADDHILHDEDLKLINIINGDNRRWSLHKYIEEETESIACIIFMLANCATYCAFNKRWSASSNYFDIICALWEYCTDIEKNYVRVTFQDILANNNAMIISLKSRLIASYLL